MLTGCLRAAATSAGRRVGGEAFPAAAVRAALPCVFKPPPRLPRPGSARLLLGGAPHGCAAMMGGKAAGNRAAGSGAGSGGGKRPREAAPCPSHKGGKRAKSSAASVEVVVLSGEGGKGDGSSGAPEASHRAEGARGRTLATIASELMVAEKHVKAAVSLLDEGNTVPFIARYRKEATGALDDAQLRTLASRLEGLDNLEARREAVVDSLAAQDVLSKELLTAVQVAATMQRLEDLYLPFRPKRSTRASVARERGLVGLAALLVAPTSGLPPDVLAKKFLGKDVPDAAAALAGARDILAEQAAETPDVRAHARRLLRQGGGLVSKRAPEPRGGGGKAKAKSGGGGGGGGGDPSTYQQYFDFRMPVGRLQHHQVLAINRGETTGALTVAFDWDIKAATAAAEHHLVRDHGPRDNRPLPRAHAAEVAAAVADGVKRLLKPAVEREVRTELTEAAAEHATKAFGINLRSLLLQPPLPGEVVLGVDPAYRTGCKLAAISPTGAVLETLALYPHPPAPAHQREAAARELRTIVERHGVSAIAIGNGTASRETEVFVASVVKELGARRRVAFTVVNEAGASVYSASELASKELPGMDVSLRGAVSIARRLQDPLAELVKIDPKSIGVGLYQHSMAGKKLSGELDGVVESAVNDVGVELNTCSPALLAHVAGLKKSIADKIVLHRGEHGAFDSRDALKKVKGLGAKTFEQCAGFLRVRGGGNDLDSTGVHPESYPAALALSKKLLPGAGAGKVLTTEQLAALKPLLERERGAVGYKGWLAGLASDLGIGEPTLADIVEALIAPGRDIRGSLPESALRTGVVSADALKEGMELEGTVRNVVAFGAFVDIGVGKDALLHVSAMPRGAPPLAVGQQVRVQIDKLDKSRQRIGVSLNS